LTSSLTSYDLDERELPAFLANQRHSAALPGIQTLEKGLHSLARIPSSPVLSSPLLSCAVDLAVELAQRGC
jgi:hypothetical protein